MMRVFISGAYRGNKKGLWFVGVILAGLIYIVYITGECVHWDEVGFAVPWHASELFQAIYVEHFFSYAFADLLSIPTATVKLVQIYGLHVSVLPVLIALAMILHFYLIKEKGISLPYWTKPSGQKAPFIKHVKMWFFWSALLLGAVLLIAAFVPRDAGTAPQLISSSPLYGIHKGPGKFGAKPTFPISWTHGMNVFVGEHLGLEPDIWGTVIGMTLMLCALLFVPFVDRGKSEPASFAEALAWKTRKWAFLLIALFWIVFVIGVLQNALAGPG
jgi:quinol-cytochrome oxidoreductase complex cytochrome b subunit